jgi:hypothetical protein
MSTRSVIRFGSAVALAVAFGAGLAASRPGGLWASNIMAVNCPPPSAPLAAPVVPQSQDGNPGC